MKRQLIMKACLRTVLLAVLLVLLASLAGCKTTRKAQTGGDAMTSYLSSKVQLTIPYKGNSMALNGTMRLVGGERMRLSLLMPFFHSEIARMEVTPDDILVIDRMNKRYVHATKAELKHLLPKRADFKHLEALLFQASEENGKRTLTGQELGLRKYEAAKLELYDFSTNKISLTPTQVSSGYRQVTLEEIMQMFMKIQQ